MISFNSIFLIAIDDWETGMMMLGITIVAFAILFILLAKFAWPSILANLDKREELIKESLNKAQVIEANIVESEKKATKKIEQANKEARAILQKAKSTAEELKKELETQTKQELENMHQRAQQKIDKIHQTATETLKEEAVELAISLAERILSNNFDKKENKQFIDKILKEN